MWEKGGEAKETKEKAAEHFVISAKLNPKNGDAFKFLGHYYRCVSRDNQRALKCYQRAVTLNPDDSESGVRGYYIFFYYISKFNRSEERQRQLTSTCITQPCGKFSYQEALCNLLDEGGKESLEVAACREASERSPRAFWAFCRLGYLQVSSS